MENGLSVAVTVSVGATTRSALDDDLASLLLVADKALYQAKAAGRNRSVFQESLADQA
jgi:diguanylate cyclase (GGDEF)-like protein